TLTGPTTDPKGRKKPRPDITKHQYSVAGVESVRPSTIASCVQKKFETFAPTQQSRRNQIKEKKQMLHSFVIRTYFILYTKFKEGNETEITTISDITSDFQLDIYISEMWLDPALDFSWMEPCKYNLSL
uniref:Uncharacterized protein n=1 Tax=Parascaris equorum TaxID=6256 RepID=A0A914RC61_PAREQ